MDIFCIKSCHVKKYYQIWVFGPFLATWHINILLTFFNFSFTEQPVLVGGKIYSTEFLYTFWLFILGSWIQWNISWFEMCKWRNRICQVQISWQRSSPSIMAQKFCRWFHIWESQWKYMENQLLPLKYQIFKSYHTHAHLL